ncbi:CobW family GTP-binding protein [Amorphus orientalis]|uniref:G3E family GTPase n=1 Tax=Amorphus orientalis TaxID=649198 RepID=A0AAE3VQI8_9HYPH|nr:GTP-binding protein [Amorphus orientalis]MDQ0316517.1 G3E family GTPase [Amorphus orientalis]
MTEPTAPDADKARRREPIPLTVITGFLGAGKTTLLNRLLKAPEMANAAVIVNEFGDIPLDHLMVENVGDDVVELSSGCLCCTVRGELVSTLEGFLRNLDNKRIERLSRVVIETTGLAHPGPILQAVMLHPYLVQRFRLDGVITLVDAVNGMATLDGHEEAMAQVGIADRIVLTKTDLLPDADRDAKALVARLSAINPMARILDNARGEATVTALTGTGLYDPETKRANVAAWLGEDWERETRHAPGHEHASGHDHGHAHAHGHDHDHPVNLHSDSVRAFTLETDRPIEVGALDMFLDLLAASHGPKLLRVKGIVKLADDETKPLVLHAVQHVFHPPVRLESWPEGARTSRLVFIVDDLPEGFVRRLFDAFTGKPSVDTPDAAALTDNPLAISGFRP